MRGGVAPDFDSRFGDSSNCSLRPSDGLIPIPVYISIAGVYPLAPTHTVELGIIDLNRFGRANRTRAYFDSTRPVSSNITAKFCGQTRCFCALIALTACVRSRCAQLSFNFTPLSLCHKALVVTLS